MIYSTYLKVGKDEIKNPLPKEWVKIASKPKDWGKTGIYFTDDGKEITVYTVSDRDAKKEIAGLSDEVRADYLHAQWVISILSRENRSARESDLGIAKESKATETAKAQIANAKKLGISKAQAISIFDKYASLVNEIYG